MIPSSIRHGPNLDLPYPAWIIIIIIIIIIILFYIEYHCYSQI